jgi:hypothetical protein
VGFTFSKIHSLTFDILGKKIIFNAVSTGNGHGMMSNGVHTSQYGSESHSMHDTIVDPLIGGQ